MRYVFNLSKFIFNTILIKVLNLQSKFNIRKKNIILSFRKLNRFKIETKSLIL